MIKMNPIDKENLEVSEVKNSLVQLAYPSNVILKNKQTRHHKIRRNSWKFGKIVRNKKKVFKAINLERSCEQTIKKMGLVPSSESNITKHLNKQHVCEEEQEEEEEEEKEEEEEQEKEKEEKQEKLFANIRQNDQNSQVDNLSLFRAQNKNDLSLDETCVSARTIPYNWKSKTLGNNEHTAVRSDALSLHLSIRKQNSSTNESSDQFKRVSSLRQVRRQKRSRFTEKTTKCDSDVLVNKGTSFQEHLNKYRLEEKDSASSDESECFVIRKKRRCVQILSDDEDAIVSNAEAIKSKNQSDGSSCEITDRRKLNTVNVSSELRVILTRLEEMNDANIVAWQQSKTLIHSNERASTYEKKSHRYKVISHYQTSDLRREKRHWRDKSSLLESGDSSKILHPHQDLAVLPNKSDDIREKKKKSLRKLNETKSQNKYKLFKKPKVLLIQLEKLRCSSKNGTYSASEIDLLTYEYIHSIFRSSPLCGSSKENNTNATTTRRMSVDNSAVYISRNKTLEQVEQTIEDNGSASEPFQIKYKSIHDVCKRPSPGQKTLLQIWKNAFCTWKPAEKLAAKQLARVSPSKSPHVLPSSPKQLTDAKRETVSNPLTSTLTTSKNTSPVKLTSSKSLNKLSTKSSSAIVNLFNDEASADEIPSENELLRSEDTVVPKSLCDTSFAKKHAVGSPPTPCNRTSEELYAKSSEKISSVKWNVNNAMKSPKVSGLRILSNQKAHITYKCVICKKLYGNYHQLQKHIADENCKMKIQRIPSMSNVENVSQRRKRLGKVKSMDSINTEKSKLLRQHPIVEKKSDGYRLSRSLDDSHNASLNTLTRRKHWRKCVSALELKKATDVKKLTESKSTNLDLQEEEISNAGHVDLCRLLKDTDIEVQNAFASIGDNTASACQRTNEVTSQSSASKAESLENDVVNRSRNVNDSGAKSSAEMRCDAITNNSCTERLLAKMSKDGSSSPVTICKCHRNKPVDDTSTQIEIVLLCVTCQTLFRRSDCFEAHFKHQENMTCAKNARRDSSRLPKLFCVNCQKMFSSLQDTLRHLVMHFRLNCNGTATFFCNICKVIFYEFGILFKTHVNNHFRDCFFVASRLSFPEFSIIGPRLEQRTGEIYLQVVDHMCQNCSKPLTTEEALISHKDSCEKNKKFSGEDNRRTVSTSTSNKKTPIVLTCGYCNEKYNNAAFYRLHSLEHKHKLGRYKSYVRVNIDVFNKIYICRICMSICKSLQKFEEHWLTHGALQEDYVCTCCDGHFDSVDQFQEHADTIGKTNQQPVICQVIYKDARNDRSFWTDIHRRVIMSNNSIPCTNLSRFGRKMLAEQNATDAESQDLELLVTTGVDQSRVEMTAATTLPPNNDSDTSRIPGEAFSTNTMITQPPPRRGCSPNDKQKSVDNATSMDDGSEDIDTEEEEEEEEGRLVIDIPDEDTDEVITLEGEIQRENGSAPFVELDDAQSNITTSSIATVSNGKPCDTRLSNVDSASDNSNDANKSSNSGTLNKGATDINKDIEDATRDTTRDRSADRSDRSAAILSSAVSSSASSAKSSMPNNINGVPKSFLRVKSMAELMKSPPSSEKETLQKLFRCFQPECKQSFSNPTELKKHASMHKPQYDRQHQQRSGKVTTSNASNAAPTQQTKPAFKALTYVPVVTSAPIITYLPIRPVTTVSSCLNVSQITPAYRRVNSVSPQQYKAVNEQSMYTVRYPVTTNNMRTNEQQQYNIALALSAQNIQAAPQTSFSQQMAQRPMLTGIHQNMPVVQLMRPNQPTQFIQQSSSTATVKSFAQSRATTPLFVQQKFPYRPMKPSLPPYRLPKPLPPYRLPKPLPSQYQSSNPSQYQSSNPSPSTSFLPNQQQLQQQQNFDQQMRTNLHIPNMARPIQQQQQPKQPITTTNNETSGTFHQYESVNTVDDNTGNVILPTNLATRNSTALMVSTISQMAKTSYRMCSYCPDVKCKSAEEFTAHLHSPRHEARSHYQGVKLLNESLSSSMKYIKVSIVQPSTAAAAANTSQCTNDEEYNVPYQLALANITNADTENVTEQVAKNIFNFGCLYCPGFQCDSKEKFAAHQRTSRHRARSKYTGKDVSCNFLEQIDSINFSSASTSSSSSNSSNSGKNSSSSSS